MIFFPLIPFILALGTGYYYFTTSLEDSSIESMKRIVEDHRHMIESFLKERKNDLDFIVHSYTFEDLSQSETLDTVSFNNIVKSIRTTSTIRYPTPAPKFLSIKM